VELLEREPATALTIKRVAEAVGSAPMALYRYFPDRDTLLQAMADHVLAHIEPSTPAGDTWQEQLRNWMRNSRDRLRPYSQLLPYMASTRQPVGLNAMVRLTVILRPLGLSDEDLALAFLHIGSTAIGFAGHEAYRPPAEQVAAALQDALALRSLGEQRMVGPLLPHFPAAYTRIYDLVLDQTVAAVGGLPTAHGSSPGR
jgi:AcrR family transcriptional regulator